MNNQGCSLLRPWTLHQRLLNHNLEHICELKVAGVQTGPVATGLIGPAVSTHIPGPGPHSVLDLGLLARGPGLSQPKHLPGCTWDATTRQGTGAFLTVIKLAKP